MTENGWLTSIEQDALEFLKMLETYYPTYVYETAKMIYNSSSDHSYHPPVTTLSPVNSTGNVLGLYPETFGGVRKRERGFSTYSDTYTCTYVV